MTKLQRFAATWLMACVGLAGAACDRSTPPGASTVASASSAGALVPVASARASASVAPAASSAPAVSPEAATKWAGAYDAKKAKLTTPDKVKDVTWTKDDGTAAVGEGKISIGVRGTTVEGTATGALGDQIVSGVYDGKELRVSLTPRDPSAPGAMSGSGIAELKDGALTGTLRCLGLNGAVVREVAFELKPAG